MLDATKVMRQMRAELKGPRDEASGPIFVVVSQEFYSSIEKMQARLTRRRKRNEARQVLYSKMKV